MPSDWTRPNNHTTTTTISSYSTSETVQPKMTDSRVTSNDANMVCDRANDVQSTIARRSVSIFSRRGTEKSEARPAFHVQSAMHYTSKSMADRQKARQSVESSITNNSEIKKVSPKPSKGTILNAVPPAKPIVHIASLEEKMTTPSTEDALPTISEHGHSISSLATHSLQNLASRQASLIVKRTSSLAHRSTSTRRRETNTRIGVWVDGVVHWDHERLPESKSRDGEMEEEEADEDAGLTALPSLPVVKACMIDRPHLSVIIPPHSSPSLHRRTKQDFAHQPHSQKHVLPAVPTNASKQQVSPMSSDLSPSATPPLPPRDPARSHPPPPPSTDERGSRASSSSSAEESASDGDDVSDCSKQSSATSVEMAAVASLDMSDTNMRPESASSGVTLAQDGVVQDSPNESNHGEKPLPPLPSAIARRSMSVAPLSSSRKNTQQIRGTKSVKTLPDLDSMAAKSVRTSRSMNQLDLFDQQFMRSSPYSLEVPEANSPTLSQAEHDLCRHLSTITKPDLRRSMLIKSSNDASESTVSLLSLGRSSSVHSVMHPPECAPPIVPPRSRRRDWRLSLRTKDLPNPNHQPSRRRSELQLKVSEPIVALHRSASVQVVGPTTEPDDLTSTSAYKNHFTHANVPLIAIDQVSSNIRAGGTDEPIADEIVVAMSASAEDVLLHILSSLNTHHDLFNTAIINKGMYRVYKENEMMLLRCVTYRQSPASWELREWNAPEHKHDDPTQVPSVLEYTPLTYLQCHRRDAAVVEDLKKLILQKCQTVIRRETAAALSDSTHPDAPRFNDAFWRIWCFCRAFGNNKGREDDVIGQLDWLKGGLHAHNQGCVAATVNTNLDFDMSSVLLNPPDYFARGNPGGLSSAQLFDMTEIWTCMVALLQGYQGRLDLARTYGIYEHREDDVDEIEKEEQILEEWTAYLLSLGPAVVLEMAELASDPSSAGFELAKRNGWTTWTELPYEGSRHSFLKESVAKLYQEHIAEERHRSRDPEAQQKKELNRQRVASLAQEIRIRRQASSYKRVPFIDMTNERPMSMFSQGSIRSIRSTASVASRGPSLPPPLPVSPPALKTAAIRIISPIVEERAEVVYQPSIYNSFSPGIAQDTSELAVHKIVEMGFTPPQAREALRATDRGNGLRVDKAIEFLLAQP